MFPLMLSVLLLCIPLFFTASANSATSETTDTHIKRIDLSPSPTGRYWIFIKPEKLPKVELERALDQQAKLMTPRALARRRKVIPNDPPIRPCDLPVSKTIIDSIEMTGCKVVRVLRYINAVTVTGSSENIETASRFGFVSEIKPVGSLARSEELEDNDIDDDEDIDRPHLKHAGDKFLSDEELYDRSWRHLSMVNVPAAHDMGIRGNGILIGLQDTGFNYLEHVCFRYMNLVAAYDFLNGDDNVDDEDDLGTGRHGTATLSMIAGLDSGNYIGVAPEAGFVLTKTENTESETPIEEDIWVEGLWFHDSIGVDVLSSSLSYRDWYSYNQIDGRTAVTTLAADSAVAAGLVIVNSTGNTGTNDWPDSKVGAPADGRWVIGAGGVRADSSYWSRSSQGPTYDGRIKPDFVAHASGPYAANDYGSGYSTQMGTSFSCPVIAGVIALILQANPDLIPTDIIDILKATSSKSDSPDTLRGWGIPNTVAAIEMARTYISVDYEKLIPDYFFLEAYPNPFNSSTTIRYNLPQAGEIKLQVIDITGRIVVTLVDGLQTFGNHNVTLNANKLTTGIYFVRLTGIGFTRTQKIIVLK